MNTLPQHRLKITLIILFSLLILVGLANTAHAKGLYEDTVLPGEDLEDDIILFGEDIVINGSVDGNVLAIGETISVNGPITGSLVAIARDINIASTIGGSLYSTAITFELASDSTILRSLYFFGVQILTGDESEVGRDLNVISISGTLSGSVGRELNAIIGPIDLFYNIQDLIDEYITSIQTSITYSPKVLVSQKFDIAGNPGIQVTPKNDDLVKSLSQLSVRPDGYSRDLQISAKDLGLPLWLTDSIITFVILLVFGLLTIWLFPTFLEKSKDQLQNRFLPSSGYGILGLVISVNLIGVVILLALIIGAIGIFLGIILLWELAWTFMAIGYSSLALATTLFAILVLFISKVIVAYFTGWWILAKINQEILKYRVLPLLLGLLIYAILIAIPYLGWVVGIIVTALGIGATWLALLDVRRQRAKASKIGSDDEIGIVEISDPDGEPDMLITVGESNEEEAAIPQEIEASVDESIESDSEGDG